MPAKAPPASQARPAPHYVRRLLAHVRARKASLVKGRWTPKAAGGIPAGVALHAITPAAGQESLRLAMLGTSL